MSHKLIMIVVSLVLCGAFGSFTDPRGEASSKTLSSKCRPNSDPSYERSSVLEQLATILNQSIPEYSRANSKGFYTDSDNAIGFFVIDLTDPSNKYVALQDCVDFIDHHVYHVAPLQSPYSLSHIVIPERRGLKVFRSINCPGRGDRLDDVITYLNTLLINDNKKNQIINRVRRYRQYGYYYSMDHAGSICKQ
jgi:hypothetical protein